MQRAPYLGLLVVLGLTACREAEEIRLPPGDWRGSCPKPRRPALHPQSTPPSSWVDDRAELFDAASEPKLESMLSAFHAETCHQFTVLTVPSLDGQTIETYANQAANRAGIGYRGFNNGLLLVFAPTEKKLRIEVGCGLEDVISDERAAAVIREQIVPALREGDFAQSTEAGLAALMELARKKHIPAAHRPAGCLQH